MHIFLSNQRVVALYGHLSEEDLLTRNLRLPSEQEQEQKTRRGLLFSVYLFLSSVLIFPSGAD